jgi:hypothetical protein
MIGIKKQSYSVVEVILKFIKSEDRCLLNEEDTFQLMNYQSPHVSDAIDTIFTPSVFNDKAPATGTIKGGGDFIFFQTEVSSNLNKEYAMQQTLEPSNNELKSSRYQNCMGFWKNEGKGESHRIEYLSSAFKMNHEPGSIDSLNWL